MRRQDLSPDIVLQSGGAQARVALRGAELLAWRVGALDLLWTPDAAVWPDTAPILFPVVGWTRDGIRHQGRHYPLGLHGFARNLAFAPVESSDAHVRLRLCDSFETRALYPFGFQFDVIHVLGDSTLTTALEITNIGDAPAPYAVGLHPGFCWPLAGSGAPHFFLFETDERPEVPVIAPGGLFSGERRSVPLADRHLALNDALFAREALCFLNVESRTLRYKAPGAAIRFDLDDFPHVALWSKPGAPFICVEAWTGHGDPVGFDGELAEKPSMRLLAPGETARHSMAMSFEVI